MGKGQYLIMQFLLFFLIGLSVFIAFSNLFKLRADSLGGDITNSTRKLINSYISSLIINSFDTCKGCDFVSVSVEIENRTGGYFHELYLNSSGLNVVSQPGGKNYLSSVHNLNSTLNFSGNSSSAKTIILIKNKNKVEAS